jgi:hypothetical protein
MASASSTASSRLYNVTLQVLKFILITLALYQLKLHEQLGFDLPATFVVINATPETQIVKDGKLNVGFYALNFLQDFKNLQLQIYCTPIRQNHNHNAPSAKPANGADQNIMLLVDQPISIPKVEKGKKPFYPKQIDIPIGRLKYGNYSFYYTVEYFGENDRSLRKFTVPESKEKKLTFRYQPGDQPKMDIEQYLQVAKGQSVQLPLQIADTEYRFCRPENNGCTPFSGVELKWFRGVPHLHAKAELREGEYRISLKSELTIREVVTNAGTGQITGFRTQYGGGAPQRARPGPDVLIEENRTTIYDCAANLVIAKDRVSVGDRIAFVKNKNPQSGAWFVGTIFRHDSAGNQPLDAVILILKVVENLPPRSSDSTDPIGRVSLFQKWLFYDINGGLRYFDLGKNIVDPDGRNDDDTAIHSLLDNSPDIRVRRMSYMDGSSDQYFEMRKVDNSFRFYLKKDPFQGPRPPDFVERDIKAWDGVNDTTLRLRIFPEVTGAHH